MISRDVEFDEEAWNWMVNEDEKYEFSTGSW
jgi:hypothetical protein